MADMKAAQSIRERYVEFLEKVKRIRRIAERDLNGATSDDLLVELKNELLGLLRTTSDSLLPQPKENLR